MPAWLGPITCARAAPRCRQVGGPPSLNVVEAALDAYVTEIAAPFARPSLLTRGLYSPVAVRFNFLVLWRGACAFRISLGTDTPL
jgi:hypothetical protein